MPSNDYKYLVAAVIIAFMISIGSYMAGNRLGYNEGRVDGIVNGSWSTFERYMSEACTMAYCINPPSLGYEICNEIPIHPLNCDTIDAFCETIDYWDDKTGFDDCTYNNETRYCKCR